VDVSRRPFSEGERHRLAATLRFTDAIGVWLAANPVRPFRQRSVEEEEVNVKATGEVVNELRKVGLKSRRALEVFLDSRPELQPDRFGGRLVWTEDAVAKVRAALVARAKHRRAAK
jgi:hypothetical protein